MSPSNRKLDALTTTRFVAALSVVFYHGGDGLSLLGLFPINPLLTSGVAAVNYFFVLSGFVMALAYHRPGQKFDFRSYWMARFSRIYPLYLFSFIIICLYYR
jgi:peptidoglycan/LPS O-acetylase OafA/YrhL